MTTLLLWTLTLALWMPFAVVAYRVATCVGCAVLEAVIVVKAAWRISGQHPVA